MYRGRSATFAFEKIFTKSLKKYTFQTCTKAIVASLSVHAHETFSDILFLVGIIRCPPKVKKKAAASAQSLIQSGFLHHEGICYVICIPGIEKNQISKMQDFPFLLSHKICSNNFTGFKNVNAIRGVGELHRFCKLCIFGVKDECMTRL